MKPEAQRIAIAKACGWTEYQDGEGWHEPGEPRPHLEVPDYLNDLNAMHEAEETILDYRHGVYQAWIFNLCGVQPDTIFASDMKKAICATAAQRAEAFLRTLGLWKEEA